MSEVVKRLRERRANVWEQAKTLADRVAEENRAFNGEEQGSWDSLNSELDALDARIKNVIDGEQRAKDAEEAFDKLNGTPRVDGKRDNERAGDVDSEQLRSFLRGDLGAPRALLVPPSGTNFRSLTKLSPGAGGNIVPTSFYDQLVQNLIETSQILRAGVKIINTNSGETIQIPKTTSHSTAALVAEAGTIGTSDPVFAQASLGAYKYGVLVQVSRELLDDTGFDLQGYLAEETGRALGNALGAHLATGTGTSQPRGIVIDATLGATTPTGVAGVPSLDNLVDLIYSVIAPYRNSQNAAFLMKDTTVGSLRKVKDTTGQPIWSMGNISAGEPQTLLGYPVYTDPFIAATAVNAKSVLFGDMSRYFVRLAGGVRFERSDEYAFNTDLVTFRALLRADAALVDITGAVKYIVGAAT